MKTITVYISLFFFLLTFCETAAQQNKLKYGMDYRHSIEPFYSHYIGFNLENSNLSSDENNIHITRSQVGSQSGDSAFGINYAYVIKPQFVLVTGVHFSNPGIRTHDKTQLELKVIKPDALPYLNQSGVLVRRQFLEIPTLIRYTMSKFGACKSFVEVGLAHQFYRQSFLRTYAGGTTVTKSYFKEDQKKYHKVAQLNLGSEVKIGGIVPIFTQLNLSYQLDPMLQSDSVDRYIAIGFSTGIRIRI